MSERLTAAQLEAFVATAERAINVAEEHMDTTPNPVLSAVLALCEHVAAYRADHPVPSPADICREAAGRAAKAGYPYVLNAPGHGSYHYDVRIWESKTDE